MILKGERQLQARFKAIGRTDVMMREIVIHGVAEAKLIHRPHRKTSNLEHTIRVGPVTKNSGQIKAGGVRNVGYAGVHELGSRPHVIRPRKARMLAWPASASGRTLSGKARKGYGGPWIRAKVVHHPGTKAYPFLRPGLQKAASQFGIQAIVKLWNGAA